jgi:hypothetical protein
MSKRQQRTDGVQKGKQTHAEGDHGEKTRQAIMQQLKAGPHEAPVRVIKAEKRKTAAENGKRRLAADRKQHDAAEKNSERERLYRDVVRGRADSADVPLSRLHGVLGSRSHRADYKLRGPDGLLIKIRKKLSGSENKA